MDDDNFILPDNDDDGDALNASFLRKAKKPKKPKRNSLIVQQPAFEKRSFKSIVEEEQDFAYDGEVTYLSVALPDSKLPKRRFCCVCGVVACYKCPKCGQSFCSLSCDETHKEMRCLKFTK